MSWLTDKIKRWEESGDLDWLREQLKILGESFAGCQREREEAESACHDLMVLNDQLRAQLAAQEPIMKACDGWFDAWGDTVPSELFDETVEVDLYLAIKKCREAQDGNG